MSGSHGGGAGGPDYRPAPLPVRAVAALSTFCGWVSAGMIAASIFITCHMIFVRYALNWSTVWQTEAVIYLMIAATLVGLPYVQRVRGHVNVDAAPRILPRRAQFALAAVVQALGVAVIAMMAWYGFEYWYEAWDWGERSNTPWGIKLWIPFLALPVGFGLFLLQLIADFAMLLLGHESPFGLEEADAKAHAIEAERQAEKAAYAEASD